MSKASPALTALFKSVRKLSASAKLLNVLECCRPSTIQRTVYDQLGGLAAEFYSCCRAARDYRLLWTQRLLVGTVVGGKTLLSMPLSAVFAYLGGRWAARRMGRPFVTLARIVLVDA